MERSKALNALAALAHATRLDLIRLLVAEGAEGLPAGEIAQRLGLAASRLSFHLSALEGAGLIRSRRVARNVIYRVDIPAIGQTVGYILNDCCCGHPGLLAACGADQGAAGAGSGTVKTCPG
jgi:DNA-binding transcriptional ArsR family regulator